MRVSNFVRFAAIAATFQGFAAAQSETFDVQDSASAPSGYYQVQEQLAKWRELHGDAWRVVLDEETGVGRFLHGGAAASSVAPRSDAEFAVQARAALAATQGIHGLDLGTLIEERVVFLPLSNAGSSDKITVRFRQEVAGVRVLGGHANVLFDMAGRVLSVDSTGLPSLGSFATRPGIDGAEALAAALAFFGNDTGLPATNWGTPELVIEQVSAGGARRPVLVWQTDVFHYAPDSEPAGYLYRVDAITGTLVNRRDAIHNFDVSGTVRSLATAGNAPNSATNPEQQIVMPYLTVTSAAGNAVTDSNGNFTIVGATAPLNVTVNFNGTFCTTNNQAQADYTLNVLLNAAAGNSVLMNPAGADLVTAEANGFNWVGKMRDWTRAVNPADATSDFLATSNVNISSSCNAFYDGGSVNYYQPGGGCVNTAYSSVVLHEMGHWLNDRYGSGNGPDGFGEGNADNFSTHILDDPIVGKDFCGIGCNVRDANNNRQFCGDNNGGCHGGVHANGEVLMGALWKVRTRLKNSLGAAAGVAASNTLFNAWMNAYNDTQIKTIVETHYLTLDDNDGNINNGTPNYADIDGGFKQQGFPGFPLPFVVFSNVTDLPDTQNEVGPYQVNATIVANLAPPLVNAQLFFRVDGGAYQSLGMTAQGGSSYGVAIPGQTAPSKVEYYLSAQDSNGNSNTFPAGGAAAPIKFLVGDLNVYFLATFETGAAGWTHGANGGTQDDWQLSSQVGANVSFGKVGDPTTAPSGGTNIWGNDLGPDGWNGLYSSSVSNWLRSPVINLSQATDTRLSLQRWLQVENASFDQARIRVNGQQVWINPTGQNLIDTSWNEMEIDISAIADGNPSVQIEFSLDTNASNTFGGWNIDNVSIFSLTSGCPPPTNYCTAKLSSTFNFPSISSSGSPSQSAGNFQVTLAGAIPNVPSIVIWGANPDSAPFNGGILCVAPPITRGPLTIVSGSGTASFAPTILIADIGTTRRYQWWFRDAADPQGTGLSNGLNVTFCD